MYEVPTTVTVGEQSFTIRNRCDYRVVLDCFSCLSDYELTSQERLLSCLIIFYEDFNDIEDIIQLDSEVFQQLIKEMYRIFNCNEQGGGVNTGFKAVDWEKDQHLICSAINKVANVEIRSIEYMHWWTFVGYYMEVGESVFATVVSIRSKIMKGKKLEKYEREFKAHNPQYFTWDSRTAEQREDEALFKEMWNSM